MLLGNWGALSVEFGCLGKRAGISSGYAVCSRLAPRRALDFGILTLMAIVCCCNCTDAVLKMRLVGIMMQVMRIILEHLRDQSN